MASAKRFNFRATVYTSIATMAASSDSEVSSHSTSQEADEQVLDGISLAPGIAIGQAHRITNAATPIDEAHVAPADRDAELDLFEDALERTDRSLRRVIAIAQEKLGEDSAAIFEAHRMMLQDEELLKPVRRRINDDGESAGQALKNVMDQHRRRLEASENEYLRERANDLADVQNRIIQQLRRSKLSTEVGDEAIVIADNLAAADVIRFNNRGIRGCVSAHGGSTSHVVLIARALGLPMVGGIPGIADDVANQATVVVDGLQGRVIVHPTPETLQFYHERQTRHEELVQKRNELVGLVPETLDGHAVRLLANIEFEEELDLVKAYGAEGVGLLRTEMLFLMRRTITLSEDEQYAAYREVIEKVQPGVSTIRLLDLGGDKMLPLAHREHNPFLGWRGIRVLLDRPELLRPQLRALLRAGAHGPLQILLPMVTHLDEIARFKDILQHVRSALQQEGYDVPCHVPVGAMVEVPSVALRPDGFASEVDFFSIGTNDLTQYVLAVDRSNDMVADRYDAFHPAVLTLIRRTVEGARAQDIPVSLCGEIGSVPHAIPILLGLGLDSISASPTYLPPVKQVIRSIRLGDATALAADALAAADVQEVHALNAAWLRDHAPEALEDLAYPPVSSSRPAS